MTEDDFGFLEADVQQLEPSLASLFQLAGISIIQLEDEHSGQQQLAFLKQGELTTILTNSGAMSGIRLGKESGVAQLPESLVGLIEQQPQPPSIEKKHLWLQSHPALFQELIHALSENLFQELVDLDKSTWKIFIQLLKELELRLSLVEINGFKLVTWVNQAKAPTGLGAENNLLGYILPNDSSTPDPNPQSSEQKFVNNINQEFKLFGRFELFSQPAFSDLITNIAEDLNNRSKTNLEASLVANFKDKESLIAQALILLNESLKETSAKAVEVDSAMTPKSKTTVHRSGQIPMVDILFINRLQPDVTQIQPVDITSHSQESVAGIIFVPKETSGKKRRAITRAALNQLYKLHPQSGIQIIALDSSQVDSWQEQLAIEPHQNKRAQNEHGQHQQSKVFEPPNFLVKADTPTVDVVTHEPHKVQIGGTQLAARVNYRGEKETLTRAVLMDFGWMFDEVEPWQYLGGFPSWTGGIAPFLRRELFPLYTRLYREDLLANSLSPRTVEEVLGHINKPNRRTFHSVDEFIALELFHRLGMEKMAELLLEKLDGLTMGLMQSNGRGPNSLQQFFKHLDARKKTIYQNQLVYEAVLLSHAHMDHDLGIGTMDDSIPLVESAITRALLMCDHRIASNWIVKDIQARKMREMGKVGIRYPVRERPFVIPKPGQRLEIATGIFVTAWDVDHSIPGALGYLLEIEHRGQVIASILYPGDYRDGQIFKDVAQHTHRRVDLVFMEGTNVRSNKKDSARHTEQDVQLNFQNLMMEAEQSRQLVIVDIIKNNYQRLAGIIQAAIRQSRTVVISPKIIKRARFLDFLVSDEIRRQLDLPDLSLPSIKIWDPPKANSSIEEDRLYKQFGRVGPEEISLNPEQFVLIRDSNEKPEQLEGLAGSISRKRPGAQKNAVWVVSSYGPYDQKARRYRSYLKDTAKKMGWDIRLDGFHASGHTAIIPADDPGARGSTYDALAKLNPRELLIGHTQQRKAVRDAILKYFSDTKIHWRLNHPHHRIPIRG